MADRSLTVAAQFPLRLLRDPGPATTNPLQAHQRDILALQAIQRLTRHHGLNLNGARYVIQCLRLLDEHGIRRPNHLDDIEVTEVRL